MTELSDEIISTSALPGSHAMNSSRHEGATAVSSHTDHVLLTADLLRGFPPTTFSLTRFLSDFIRIELVQQLSTSEEAKPQ
jgi:hypothetical protein